MKTERFTAVKRSVFLYEYHRICVLRSLLQPLLGNPDEAVPQQPEIIRTAELLGEYMICLFYAVFRPISQGILFTT